MKNFKKLAAFVLVITLSATGMIINKKEAMAYTQPVITNSGITYPISLDSGKDLTGKTVFSDKKFLNYIANEVFMSGDYYGMKFDLDDDGKLSKDECELVRIIAVDGNSDITSLDGIEAFPKLRELYCNNTGITELDLSNNPRLQMFSCANTKIKNLNLTKCVLLKELKFSGCSIAAIDLSQNTALTSLICKKQEISSYEYKENGKYYVSLNDLSKEINLSKVSEVRIDGAAGDGINSGYDKEKGLVYCSDEIKKVTYIYDLGIGTKSDNIDTELEVTLDLNVGVRECYDSMGGSAVLPQYVEKGNADTEPESPKKVGYKFTGWYTDTNCTIDKKWSFNQEISDNIILYAGWEKQTYKVKYTTGYTALNEITADWWSTNIIPKNNIQRLGYIFKSWVTETGLYVNSSNSSKISYGMASGNSDKEYTILRAVWEGKTGYNLKYDSNLSNKQKKKLIDAPEYDKNDKFSWDQKGFISDYMEGGLPGHQFKGWYTAKNGGKIITENTTYGDLYGMQFTGDSVSNIPTIFAKYTKTKYTITYDTRGGSNIADRTNVEWGSSNILPNKKPTKKGYVFGGWKLEGKKVTKKTKLNDENSVYAWDEYAELTAVWTKKKVKKGTTFKRYGCTYQILKSNKKSDRKGNKVALIKVKKKKLSLKNTVFYNGKYYKITSIKKKALKNKKVILKVSKKLTSKYKNMIKKSGGKLIS